MTFIQGNRFHALPQGLFIGGYPAEISISITGVGPRWAVISLAKLFADFFFWSLDLWVKAKRPIKSPNFGKKSPSPPIAGC